MINIRDVIRYLNRFDKTPRPMTLFMEEYFGGRPVIGAEIGVDNGGHSLQFLKHLNIKDLCLIDPYEPYEDYRKGEMVYINETVQKDKKDQAHRRLQKYEDQVMFIYEDSTKCFNNFSDGFFDFVYIDGNHSREFIEADLRCYYPKVKPGGIIGGHDFSGTHIAVVREVLKFEKMMKLPLYSKDIEWWFVCEK